MTSSPRTDLDPAARASLRRQEVVADLGERALETDDLERLLADAAGAVAETLNVEFASVLEVCPEGRETPSTGSGMTRRVHRNAGPDDESPQ